MKICDFVKWELDVFRQECNFTDEELVFFEYRSKNEPLAVIAEKMNISDGKADNLSRKVKKKILRVIDKM